MDFLEQSKQQNSAAFREQKSVQVTDTYGREYSSMVALIIRLSGGRINDIAQASYVLLGVSVVIILIAASIFFGFDAKNPVPIPSPVGDNPILP